MSPRASEVHRQAHMRITGTEANPLVHEHITQIPEPSTAEAGVTVEHGRLVEMGGERRHKTERCPRISEMKQSGRTTKRSWRMEHPHVPVFLDLQAKLFEDTSHGPCIFSKSSNTTEGHA